MGAREFMKRCAAIGLSLTMAVTNTGGINMLVSAAEEEVLIVEDAGTPETLPADSAEQDSSVPKITVEAETVLPQDTEAVVETASPVSEEVETVSAGSEGTEKVTEAVSSTEAIRISIRSCVFRRRGEQRQLQKQRPLFWKKEKTVQKQ